VLQPSVFAPDFCFLLLATLHRRQSLSLLRSETYDLPTSSASFSGSFLFYTGTHSALQLPLMLQ
jgi:hypothetical protein